VAKPDEKLTKTAILSGLIGCLNWNTSGEVPRCRLCGRRVGGSRWSRGHALEEPVAGRPHLGPPVVTHSGQSGCGKGYAKRNRWSSTRRNIGSTREEYKVGPCCIRSY